MSEKQALVDVVIHVNTADNFIEAVTMFNKLIGTFDEPVEKMRELQKQADAGDEKPVKTKKTAKEEKVTETEKTVKTEKTAKEEKATETEDKIQPVSQPVSIADIKLTMSDLIKAGKKDDARSLLDGFGAGRVADLAEDQYSEFLDKLKELL